MSVTIRKVLKLSSVTVLTFTAEAVKKAILLHGMRKGRRGSVSRTQFENLRKWKTGRQKETEIKNKKDRDLKSNVFFLLRLFLILSS